MSKDLSFDPKSWSSGGASKGDEAKTEGEEASRESVPELWREAGQPSEPRPADSQPKSRSSGPRLALLGLAGAVLAGGAVWAMMARQDGEAEASAASGGKAASQQARPEAREPVEGAVVRALNLSSLADLESALQAVGVPARAAQQASAAAAQGGGASGAVRATVEMLGTGGATRLEHLQLSFLDGSGMEIVPEGDSFVAKAVAAHLEREIMVLNGELDSESFYSSAVSAGVIDALIPNFINAFAFDFNLASEVSPGDTFEVAYEQQVNDQGDAVGPPTLLFASLTTKTKSLDLYRFAPPGGKIAWYDGNGASTKRGFMRTPIDGARISSKFGMRFHPVLKYNRLHGGVDFAAPVGTPIYAAANGTVLSASPSRCAGNMAILNHDKGHQTRYFHLSRYADGLTAGKPVQQGDTIGYVGNTGTCTTGPHLHYEVLIDGQKTDPLSVRTMDNERARLDGKALASFNQQRDRVDAARAKGAH